MYPVVNLKEGQYTIMVKAKLPNLNPQNGQLACVFRKSVHSITHFNVAHSNNHSLILIVFNSLPKPSKAKYSHCIGMITASDAVSALRVNSPREGAQSIMI